MEGTWKYLPDLLWSKGYGKKAQVPSTWRSLGMVLHPNEAGTQCQECTRCAEKPPQSNKMCISGCTEPLIKSGLSGRRHPVGPHLHSLPMAPRRRWSPKRQHSCLPGLKQTQKSWSYLHSPTGLWIKLGGDGHEERQRIKSLLLLSPILDEQSILFLRLTLEDSNHPKQSLAYGQNLLTWFWNYIILVFLSQVFNHQLKEH